MALTLRTLGGLRTEEIARAFLVPETRWPSAWCAPSTRSRRRASLPRAARPPAARPARGGARGDLPDLQRGLRRAQRARRRGDPPGRRAGRTDAGRGRGARAAGADAAARRPARGALRRRRARAARRSGSLAVGPRADRAGARRAARARWRCAARGRTRCRRRSPRCTPSSRATGRRSPSCTAAWRRSPGRRSSSSTARSRLPRRARSQARWRWSTGWSSTTTTTCTPRAPSCCAGWAATSRRAPPTSARWSWCTPRPSAPSAAAPGRARSPTTRGPGGAGVISGGAHRRARLLVGFAGEPPPPREPLAARWRPTWRSSAPATRACGPPTTSSARSRRCASSCWRRSERLRRVGAQRRLGDGVVLRAAARLPGARRAGGLRGAAASDVRDGRRDRERARAAADRRRLRQGRPAEVALNSAQAERLRAHVRAACARWASASTTCGSSSGERLAQRVRVAGARSAMFSPHAARVHPVKLAAGLAAAVQRARRADLRAHARTRAARARSAHTERRGGASALDRARDGGLHGRRCAASAARSCR